jgi:hypothetical protein
VETEAAEVVGIEPVSLEGRIEVIERVRVAALHAALAPKSA